MFENKDTFLGGLKVQNIGCYDIYLQKKIFYEWTNA